MDFPDEWNFSKAGLIALCPDGESAVDSALNELKEWGYLEIEVKMPNENTTVRIQTVYNFYEYSAKYTSIPLPYTTLRGQAFPRAVISSRKIRQFTTL